MDKRQLALFYIMAGLFNLGIVPFSKFFSDDLGSVDPFFCWEGCVMILLWGLAYASVSNVVEQVPVQRVVQNDVDIVLYHIIYVIVPIVTKHHPRVVPVW